MRARLLGLRFKCPNYTKTIIEIIGVGVGIVFFGFDPDTDTDPDADGSWFRFSCNPH